MAITTPNDGDMQGWPKELYVLKGSAFERKIRCAWGDRYALATELDTYPNSIYPYNTDVAALIHSIKIDPEKKSESSNAGAGMIAYRHAILTCNYSTQGPSTADLVSEWITPGLSGVKIPTDTLYWDTNATDPVGTGQRLVPIATYNLKYHRLAAVPASTLILPGYINSNTVTTKILGISFSAGFLLYRGAPVSRTLTAAGITMFEVTHNCSYAYNNGFGWTRFFNPATGTFAVVYDKTGTLVAPYQSAVFSL